MDIKNLTRRNFLKVAGLLGVGAGVAACAPAAPATPTPMPGMDMTQQATANAEMDAMHEKGVKIYLDYIGKDPKFWDNKLKPTEKDGFKVFEVTCKDIKWEIEPGKAIEAMAYNGIVPGPEIRVTEGDKVRVVCKNEMKQSTAIHFHGVLVPNSMDGVPYITQPPIKTGQTFTYEFTAKNPGSHMYHSHHNAAEQVTKGLMAPFIIEPKEKSKEPKVDGDRKSVV